METVLEPSTCATGQEFTRQLNESAQSIALVKKLVAEKLTGKVIDIDLKSEYPEQFLRELGQAGGFRGAMLPEYGGNGLGLKHVIQVMEEVSKVCLSTGFLVWAQTACARYIELSTNESVKQKFLPLIASGEQLVGTGLSNTIKSSHEVEEYRLSARRVEGGYLINGVLPWVSNLGAKHFFTTGCPVEGEPKGNNGLVYVLVDCSQPNFKLVDCAHFVAIDGTRTLACHFKDTFIPNAMVLSHPGESAAYTARIMPAMVLAQMGMGLGLIDDCVAMMKQSNRTHSHVNQYLDDQADVIEAVLTEARASTYALADTYQKNLPSVSMLDILKLRLAGGEYALKAANSAMLHMGAKGYLQKSPAQRRLREAYFIAVVTPATKHLRAKIAQLEAPATCAPA